MSKWPRDWRYADLTRVGESPPTAQAILFGSTAGLERYHTEYDCPHVSPGFYGIHQPILATVIHACHQIVFHIPERYNPAISMKFSETPRTPMLSTSDFDEAIDWASRSTVRRELEDMRESGTLESKKAGKNPTACEVCYPVGKLEEIPQATPTQLSSCINTRGFPY